MARLSEASSLSPREQFQNSVRNLQSDDVRRHRRNKSISLKYNPFELQHVSSLRVSPVRRVPVQADANALNEVKQPDFGTQERDVWSRTSPTDTAREELIASPNQYRDQFDALPPLCPQLTVQPATEERPKTRRGPSGVSAFEAFGQTSAPESNADATSVRAGKFTEGTMTSRSSAVASTWSDSEYATSSSEAEDTDSDATPKAGRKRRSSSIDLRDFQPQQSTPSGLRRTLFGRRGGKKDAKPDTDKKPKQTPVAESEQAKKPRRRLRKSISKLGFLGDKMKLFGSSSQDLREQEAESQTQSFLSEKSVLDERKRKAEAAYAQQFGLKKQRDNQGLANVTSSPEIISVEEFGGNQKYDSSTVRCRGGTLRSRRTSTGSMQTIASLSRQGSTTEHDFRKRPTRRELEKENEHLRALLRESQTGKEPAIEQTLEQMVGYVSEPESIPPVPPLRIRRQQPMPAHTQPTAGPAFTISQDQTEPVPPVPPQHPDRRSVLGNVSNNRNRRAPREIAVTAQDLVTKAQEEKVDGINPLHNAPKLAPTPSTKPRSVAPRHSVPALPTSVSMILEEPENETDEKKKSLRSRTRAAGKENSAVVAAIVNSNTGSNARKEEWEWPEDVF